MTDRHKIRRTALTGILAAGAIVLSFLEGLLPPIPGMPPGAKLGLSNIVSMCAARDLGLVQALSVNIIKSVFVLVTRGATAFFMSLSGGVASAVVSFLLLSRRCMFFGCTGIGICSALAHNAGQLSVSVIIAGTAMTYYAPFLIIFSLITGSATGFILRRIPDINRLKRY